MTRATLLHVLDRPTALGPAEVRELEQLAQAFPYCQTAHLLLAKAAHDQGTMLAGQRLRRAATYAADRTLLRRLIEQVAPAAEVPAVAEPVAEGPPLTTEAPFAPAPTVAEELTPAPVQAEQVAIPLPPATGNAETTQEPANSPVAPIVLPEQILLPVATAEPPAPESEPSPLPSPAMPAAATSATVVADESSAEEVPAQPPVSVTPVTAEVAASPAPALETELPVLLDLEGVQLPANGSTPVVKPTVQAADTLTPTVTESAQEDEMELPAQAPAIRPPAEAGEARFEFGLAETPAAIAPTYELPGLVDEWAAAATTLSLAGPELLNTKEFLPETAPTTPQFTPAAFTGDAEVGYAFGESSRLGFSMQLLDLLAAKAETAETVTAVVAAAQPAAVALPPAGAFFEPDPLLLDHWATHCPPPPALPSPLDLINSFLKRQPRLTRPGMLPPAPGGQTDLSARSTRAEPDLVSENLARIFVRQGKIARAIEIYEKLMVKHPEKMAYFAAQIQSLQPSA
ncbi:hypothetical protein [Hymenobacter rubidus]|uniref:hypothetical protein n=1 Tax=Hymenobacter rubidus TaxID=1441626 RepID=UPI00191F2B4E|nr:hypothetical protein [Hymenobacter rubidus]